MKQPVDAVSEVWRQACRHIDIVECVTAISGTLAEHLPLQAVAVLRVTPADRRIETLAVSGAGRSARQGFGAVVLEPAAWRRLSPWLRGSDVDGATVLTWLRAVLPEGLAENALAGPLHTADGTGILVLVAREGATFSTADRRLARQLLEPLAAAFENDGRLHELRTLREAAEADRQTLLSRLGRQHVSEELVGGRTGLRHVLERVELVARSDLPVLILGETGTGKEVVSRAIHSRSKRGDGPFIRVNCGAIPAELVDSQLFGHEKGSFTGAAEQHQGWFERADGGTLFLDEIGELPLPAQVRLLRVLQDHQIERVGGRAPLHVDVRIVAATHRDLAAMVKERTFREDLWYRINVFPILLPTLRERMEDIPDLVRHFVQRATTRFGLPAVEPTEADLAQLTAYDWPGNIRELGAVIDRAVILGAGRVLDVAAALGLGGRTPTALPQVPSAAGAGAPTLGTVPTAPTGMLLPLAAAMRQHIERALVATRGRVEGRRGAAALLEINPHTLRARMRKLGIDAARFRD
ncbi:MAG: sigma-54-dependent Fis family transcriptional regulator [Planctomycetota bacterium]|nr:MAG: sigma-54-dependent Fis family transcriptional regulator [Planctomycetota bacterium]